MLIPSDDVKKDLKSLLIYYSFAEVLYALCEFCNESDEDIDTAVEELKQSLENLLRSIENGKTLHTKTL